MDLKYVDMHSFYKTSELYKTCQWLINHPHGKNGWGDVPLLQIYDEYL